MSNITLNQNKHNCFATAVCLPSYSLVSCFAEVSHELFHNGIRNTLLYLKILQQLLHFR